MTIKQQSQEWLTEKRKYIGGSEIFAIALHYCKKELAQISIENESSFKTALETYLEKKFNVEPDPINQVYSEFGLGMEDYIKNRFNRENKIFAANGSENFIVNCDIHNLAACSPDGFVEAKEDFVDYDKKPINKSKGVLEIKTTPYSFNFEAEAGASFQYLFQLQYNMMVCGNDWGLLTCLTPKEKDYDEVFFKGKVLGMLQGGMPFENIDRYYNLYTYTYKANKTIQSICKLALKRFQEAMDNIILPNLSDNKEKLLREKKSLAKMYPSKYGELVASDELNALLNERAIINNEFTKLKTELEETNCKIIQGIGKHISATGIAYVAKFDKRGSLRITKNRGN